jgi:hypothetical protein
MMIPTKYDVIREQRRLDEEMRKQEQESRLRQHE